MEASGLEALETPDVLRKVEKANAQLAAWLALAGECLEGRRNFEPEDVRAAAAAVAAMDGVAAQAPRWRAADSQLKQELELYARNLRAVQTALDRLRCALLARTAGLDAQRAHRETLAQWTAAWRRTQNAPQA
jgi:hypothetical protein